MSYRIIKLFCIIFILLCICINLYAEEIENTENNANKLYQDGLKLFHQNNEYKEALIKFQEASKLMPQKAIYHHYIAWCYIRLKEYESAIPEAHLALKYESNKAETHYLLGYAYLQTNQLDNTIKYANKAIELKSDYAQAYNLLGSAYIELGDCEKAKEACREALRLNPESEDAQNNLNEIEKYLNETKKSYKTIILIIIGFIIILIISFILHRLLVPKVVLDLDDPYDLRGPIITSDFYGRKNFLEQILQDLHNGLHINILGLRKTGKTSLTYKLKEKLSQYIVIYLDFQGLTADITYVLGDLVRQLIITLKEKKYLLATESWEEIEKKLERTFLQETLERLLRLIKANKSNMRIIFFLDEADLTLPAEIETEKTGETEEKFKGYIDLWAFLRKLAQEYPGLLVLATISSTPRLNREAKWNGIVNPIFQFFRERFIPPLKMNACYQMMIDLGKRKNLKYNKEALKLIYQESAGQPFIARQLGSCLLQQDNLPKIIGEANIKESIKKYLSERAAYMKQLYNFLSPIEQNILIQIILNDKIIKRDLALYAHQKDWQREQLEKALSNLMNYYLLEIKQEQYFMRLPLLERWIRYYELGLDWGDL